MSEDLPDLKLATFVDLVNELDSRYDAAIVAIYKDLSAQKCDIEVVTLGHPMIGYSLADMAKDLAHERLRRWQQQEEES